MAINFGSVSGYAVPTELVGAVQRDVNTGNYEWGSDNALYAKGYAPRGGVAPQLTAEEMKAAEKRQAGHMADQASVLNKLIPGGVNGIQTKEAGSYSNGNPIYSTGFGSINFGNGQSIRVPNAVLQSLANTTKVNPTTYNANSFWQEGGNVSGALKLMAQNEKEGRQTYTSFGAQMGKMEELNKKWEKQMNQYTPGDFLSNVYSKQMEIQKIGEAIKAAQARVNNSTETFNPSGQLTGGTYAAAQADLDKLRAELQQKGNEYNQFGRGDRVRADEANQSISNAMANDYRGILTPTVSNLPITETYTSTMKY